MTSELAESRKRERQKERLQDALYFALSDYSGVCFSWEDGAALTEDEINKCWESALLNYQKVMAQKY
jgi:hypothetical protein